MGTKAKSFDGLTALLGRSGEGRYRLAKGVGEEEQKKQPAPPVSAFHVPTKTAVKELRGECEGGEERSELESEKLGNMKQELQVVDKVQGAPERVRKEEEEEEEEAVIEEELGSIVHDMQISAWTEGTHI